MRIRSVVLLVQNKTELREHAHNFLPFMLGAASHAGDVDSYRVHSLTFVIHEYSAILLFLPSSQYFHILYHTSCHVELIHVS